MKSKTTLNLFKKNSSNRPQIMWNYVFIMLLTCSISYSQTNSCSATLQANKNRSSQSIPPEGTFYSMEISNTGISNATYVLSSSNVNSSCSNNDETNTSGNVNLTISFSDTASNSISEISVAPGETAIFLVNLKVPAGTAVNKWNCTEISATSSTCTSYKVSTILHTLVSDPNQE